MKWVKMMNFVLWTRDFYQKRGIFSFKMMNSAAMTTRSSVSFMTTRSGSTWVNMINFLLRTRNCVSKTRNFVSKTRNYALQWWILYSNDEFCSLWPYGTLTCKCVNEHPFVSVAGSTGHQRAFSTYTYTTSTRSKGLLQLCEGYSTRGFLHCLRISTATFAAVILNLNVFYCNEAVICTTGIYLVIYVRYH